MSRLLKVLVVDDNQVLAQSTAEVLRSKEKIERADFALDGFEAVEMLTDTEYDALLLDIIMPKLDGFGVMEQPAGFRLPVSRLSDAAGVRPLGYRPRNIKPIWSEVPFLHSQFLTGKTCFPVGKIVKK